MATGKLSEINVTPLVDVLLVLLIIFMVTTAAVEQKRAEAMKQDSVQDKTQNLVSLNLPVTPDNAYLADPDTTKLVVVIDKSLRVYVVRGLSAVAGQDPVADCANKPASQWQPCFEIIAKTLGQNQRMLKEGLYLEADADTPYGFVSGVLQALRVLGLQAVDIVTDPNYHARAVPVDIK
ncbi:MAG: biopolymer transporter ExbD [Muribaculaceae bacterium]|nr:biopolymer transporter ExbD [Muribaculaceae bacterium]